MLASRVINAVKEGKFNIYTTTSVDDALSLLMGRTMGTENSQGKFASNTVNQLIVKRLRQFSNIMKPFRASQ